ncbi:tetratricopeptide repeat protein, partial [Halarcobacter sp.]
MFKNFFFTIFLSLFFVSFLEASNEKINQQIYEPKTSQDYTQKINDEKITLIMEQIIQKELKEYVNKDDLQREINYQNNRIDDINSSVDRLSIIVSISIGLFGVLITGIVIFFAFKFERIARFKAEEEVKSWIDEKAQKVFNNIIEKSKKELEEKAEKELLNIKNETNDKIDEFIDGLKNRNDLKRKEKNYKETFKLVIENYKDNNIEKAITNIKDAIQLAENEKDTIQSLFTHALLLEQLNRSEEAIEVYDEIVKRFENSEDNSILEQVASALVN